MGRSVCCCGVNSLELHTDNTEWSQEFLLLANEFFPRIFFFLFIVLGVRHLAPGFAAQLIFFIVQAFSWMQLTVLFYVYMKRPCCGPVSPRVRSSLSLVPPECDTSVPVANTLNLECATCITSCLRAWPLQVPNRWLSGVIRSRDFSHRSPML